jgi:tetratricopeptide (TPR) repeat protein
MVIQRGRYDEADALLDQAAFLDPEHGGVYITRGNLMILRGRPDDAIQLYEQAKRVDPYRASTKADEQIAWVRQQMLQQQ